MVIYKTTNLIDGKFYVGKDEKNNPQYLGSGLRLNRAIKKYGIQNFKKEILEFCLDKKMLSEREKFWIKNLDAIKKGYNIALGGAGGDTYSENPNLVSIKEKFKGGNNPFYGKTHSADSRIKISEGNLGREAWNKGKKYIYTEKHLENLSNIRKEKYSGSNHPRYIDIPEDELVDLLKSMSPIQISKHYGVSKHCIYSKLKYYQINYKQLNKEGDPKRALRS